MKTGSLQTRLGLLVILLAAVGIVAYFVSRQMSEARAFQAIAAALARGDLPEARQAAAARLRRRPNDVETLLLAAQAERRSGDLAAATRRLDAAERIGEMPEAVLFERNLVAIQSGQLGLAGRYLEIAETHPEAAESPLILEALVVGSLQRLDLPLAQRCVAAWNAQAKSIAERTRGQIWSGEVALRRGEADAAADFYRAAVDAAPQDDAARLRLAELLARQAPAESLQHLDRLSSTRPDDPKVLLTKARCHRALGDHEQAAQILDRVLAESARDYDVLLERGQVALEMRQFDVAEQRLKAAVKVQPQRRDANLALARCLQSLGRDEEARGYREHVARIDAELDERLRRLRETGRLDQ